MSNRLRTAVAAAALLLAGLARGGGAAGGGPPRGLPFEGPCLDARDICPPGALEEPSGVAFHPERRTLFAVGDEGEIAELSLEGKLLARRRLGGDLEGVTAGPRGRLVVVVEEPPALLYIDPATLAVERRVPVDPGPEGARAVCIARGAGLEGVAWVPSLRRLFAVNQHSPARLVELSIPDGPGEARVARIVAELDMPVECCSDLAWDEAGRRFRIVSSSFRDPRTGRFRRGRLWEVSLEGEVVGARELPGEAQEGFCVDDAGAAYIACDTGGVLKVEPAPASLEER